MATVQLKFKQTWRNHNSGELATFDGNAALSLIAENIATLNSGTLPLQVAPLQPSGNISHDGNRVIR